MDMDVFDKGDDYGVDEGDEETSFIDVDEDYYDNFSRAAESGRMGHYDWGSPEQYEAARTKYNREHGASNIPSWMELPDRDIDPLFEEDPLTTIEGAKERILELEPNTNLDEIRLSKKDGKIYIRVLNKKPGKWTVEEQLFTKDGEIRAKVRSYEGFKDATRSRLQELEELNIRVDAFKKVEELQKELEYYKQQFEDQLDVGFRLINDNDEAIKKYSALEEHNALKEHLLEIKRSLGEASLGKNKEISDKLLKTLKEKENTLEEIKELKQTLYENERDYMRQNKLLLDAQGREKEFDSKQIEEITKQKNWYRKEADATRKKLNHTLRMVDLSKMEIDDLEITIDGALEERKQLQQDIKIKEEQLRQMEQAIEDLERQAERQREVIRDQSKTEEEIEAAKEKLEGIQERIAEAESKKENSERVLGLTRREKIKRLLQKAGLGVVLAGAVAGIASLIMNIINPVGKGLKKLGNEAGKQFKKLSDEAGKEFKKLGKELADTGKKLAASIPGLLGSVLSLILKTGGELLKFIGNNIWILVVALGAVILKSLTDKR